MITRNPKYGHQEVQDFKNEIEKDNHKYNQPYRSMLIKSRDIILEMEHYQRWRHINTAVEISRLKKRVAQLEDENLKLETRANYLESS